MTGSDPLGPTSERSAADSAVSMEQTKEKSRGRRGAKKGPQKVRIATVAASFFPHVDARDVVLFARGLDAVSILIAMLIPKH